MATTKFKVVSETGVSLSGVKREKGDEFYAESKSAHVKTALHFKQIEAVDEAASDTGSGEGPAKPATGKKKAKKEEKEAPAGDGNAPENPPALEPAEGAGASDPDSGGGDPPTE